MSASEVGSLEDLLEALEERRTSAQDRGWPKSWSVKPATIPWCRPDQPPQNNQPAAVHLNDYNLDQEPQVAPGSNIFMAPRNCVVCLTAPAPACCAVVGCGHLCLCWPCALQIRATVNKCPTCNCALLGADGKLQIIIIL
jgi:Zinc finger, C3HC4 type (RING finger)